MTTASVIGGALVVAHFAKAVSTLDRNTVDFEIFYEAVRRWADGGSLYDPSHAVVNYNPPQFHLLIAPLAALPPVAAFVAWTLLSVAAAFLTVRIAIHEAPRLDTGDERLVIAAILLSAGTGATIHLGQVSWIVALILTCGWRAARHERWSEAGAWLGIAAGLKPFLLLFAPMMLMRRRWRCAAAMAPSFALSVAMGTLVFGGTALGQWLTVLRAPPPASQVPYFINASLSAILARASAPPLVSISMIAGFAVLSIALARKADEDMVWLVTTTSAVLISPLGWVYYLPLLTGPLLAAAANGVLPRWTWGIWPLLAVPAIGREWLQTNAYISLTVGSVYAWGLLGLWMAEAVVVLGPRHRILPRNKDLSR